MNLIEKISSKITLSNLPVCLFIIYLFNNIFLDDTYFVFISLPKSMSVVCYVLDILTMGIAIICIFRIKYTRKELLVIIGGYVFLLMVAIMAPAPGLLVSWTFILLARQTTYRKWIKATLFCYSITLTIGIIATILGLHQEIETTYRSVLGIRYTFGFRYELPNVTGSFITLSAMCYGWLKGKDLRAKDFLFMGMALIVCFVFPNSVGASVVLFVYLCLMLLFRYCHFTEKSKSFFSSVLFYVAVLMPIIDIILVIIDVTSIPILSYIDVLCSLRFSGMHSSFERVGFSIFGQIQRNYYADCGWMNMPMFYGIIFAVLFIYLYFSTMRIFVKRKDVVTVIVFFCLSLYEMESTVFPTMFRGFFLVFLSERIFLNCHIMDTAEKEQKDTQQSD